MIVKPVRARRILALARLARLRHRVHQPFAGGVLAVLQLQRIGRGAQPRRQPERQAHRHRAAVALERNDRPAATRRQHVLLDGGFECVVVRADNPARIRCSFDKFRRHRIARQPQLHRIIVDGECHADNLRRSIRRILGRADLPQADRAPGFDVAVQNVLGGDADRGHNAVRQGLMHDDQPRARRRSPSSLVAIRRLWCWSSIHRRSEAGEGRNQVSDSWADAVLTRQVEVGADAGLNDCYPPREEWQLRNRLSFLEALGTGFQVQDFPRARCARRSRQGIVPPGSCFQGLGGGAGF